MYVFEVSTNGLIGKQANFVSQWMGKNEPLIRVWLKYLAEKALII